jgi:hypothetical protein
MNTVAWCRSWWAPIRAGVWMLLLFPGPKRYTVFANSVPSAVSGHTVVSWGTFATIHGTRGKECPKNTSFVVKYRIMLLQMSFRSLLYILCFILFKTIILTVVLYGCQTWSLTLREEHRLRVFQNRVLRRIFGPKRDEVTGEWKKLHNKELHDLYFSPSIIRGGWDGRVMYHEWGRWRTHRLLVGKPEEKRPLGRPRRGWVDNIRMDLGEVGWGDVDWIGLAQDRNRWRALVSSVLNLRVPWNAGKLSNGLTSSGLSSSVQLHRVS